MRRRFILACGVLALGIIQFLTINTAYATFINGGFELDAVGTFESVTGWDSIGKTSILDATSNVTPTEGSNQILLSTFGDGIATPDELAEFIFGPGTTAADEPFFDDSVRGRVIGGSAIKQTFTFAEGQSIFWDAAHVSAEPFSGFSLKKIVGTVNLASIGPGGVNTPDRFEIFSPDPDFTDIAGRPGGALIASMQINYMPEDNFIGFMGPGTVDIIFAELAVEGLGTAGSGLLLDNFRLIDGPIGSIAEPSTLALFATGLAGLGFMMRRRRRST